MTFTELVRHGITVIDGLENITLAAMPLVYAARRLDVYRRTLLPWGSAAIAVVAMTWLLQRAFLAG